MKYSIQRAGLSLPDPAPYSMHLYSKSRRGSGVGRRPLRWKHAAKALAWPSRQRGWRWLWWWWWGEGWLLCPPTSPPGVEWSKEAAAGGAAARLLILASHQRCNLFSSLRCLLGSNSSGSNTNFNLEWEWSWREVFFLSLSSFRVGNLCLRARKKDSAPVNSGGC